MAKSKVADGRVHYDVFLTYNGKTEYYGTLSCLVEDPPQERLREIAEDEQHMPSLKGREYIVVRQNTPTWREIMELFKS